MLSGKITFDKFNIIYLLSYEKKISFRSADRTRPLFSHPLKLHWLIPSDSVRTEMEQTGWSEIYQRTRLLRFLDSPCL